MTFSRVTASSTDMDEGQSPTRIMSSRSSHTYLTFTLHSAAFFEADQATGVISQRRGFGFFSIGNAGCSLGAQVLAFIGYNSRDGKVTVHHRKRRRLSCIAFKGT